jgi:MEMO1 family protein
MEYSCNDIAKDQQPSYAAARKLENSRSWVHCKNLSRMEILMSRVRTPAVAGYFYPADPRELRGLIDGYLAAVPAEGPVPKAVVVPHAGYVYSGAVAASVYARLRPARGRITRVVLLGPAHRVGVSGLALPDAETFLTPLGRVAVDPIVAAHLADLPQVHVNGAAHAQEHSLEVQLPFLQEVLGEFVVVPLVVGDAGPAEVGEVLERLWGGDDTLIVVSTDLSHYHDYATAQRRDRATSAAVEKLEYERIGYDDACGRNSLNGLLWVARRRGLRVQRVDLRNSGDTAGGRERVVGYGAYAVQ